jgi:hypothetical protein
MANQATTAQRLLLNDHEAVKGWRPQLGSKLPRDYAYGIALTRDQNTVTVPRRLFIPALQ